MKPIFIQQQGETDCGVTCLLSIIRMYGGNTTLENLRRESGTSIQGTTLLGLQQAAQQYGFIAEAFEVDDIAVFQKEATFPCLLHVVINNHLEHYVVCTAYQPSSATYTIIDPAKGIETWDEAQLLAAWKSRAMLLFTVTPSFKRTEQTNIQKTAWLKSLVKEDLPLLLMAVVIGAIMAILGMSTALYSQKLIDVLLPQKQFTKVWLGIVLLTVLLLARAGLSYLRSFFLLRQAKNFNNRLMDDFYEKLLLLPKIFFDGRKTGELIARLNDTRRIQSVISYLVGNVVIDTLVAFVSFGFLASYSWKIALISTLGIPLFAWLIKRYNQRIIKQQKEVMQQYANTESHFVDVIGGIDTVKAATKERFFGELGKQVYRVFQDKIYQLGTVSNVYTVWGEVINTLLISGIIGIASWMVLTNQLLIGEMMAVLTIAIGLIGAMARLATTNIQLQEAKVAFERMYEFAAITPEVQTTENKQSIEKIQRVDITNLSFRFAGKSQLLKRVSLPVEQGKLTILLGEVGSGKSILLQLLQKFLSYEEGYIFVNTTTELQQIDTTAWRKQLGVVPQEVKLFSGTLLENIVLGNIVEEAKQAVQFCNEIGLSAYFEQLPQGYFQLLAKTVSSYLADKNNW